MEIIDNLIYVKSRVLPGYCLARVLALYKNGWYLLRLEGSKDATFLMPKLEVEDSIICKEEDLHILLAAPEIQKKLDEFRKKKFN